MKKCIKNFKDFFINLSFTLIFYTLFTNIAFITYLFIHPHIIHPLSKPSDFNFFIRIFEIKRLFIGYSKHNSFLGFISKNQKFSFITATDIFYKVAKNLHDINLIEKNTMPSNMSSTMSFIMSN